MTTIRITGFNIARTNNSLRISLREFSNFLTPAKNADFELQRHETRDLELAELPEWVIRQIEFASPFGVWCFVETGTGLTQDWIMNPCSDFTPEEIPLSDLFLLVAAPRFKSLTGLVREYDPLEGWEEYDRNGFMDKRVVKIAGWYPVDETTKQFTKTCFDQTKISFREYQLPETSFLIHIEEEGKHVLLDIEAKGFATLPPQN